MSINESVPDMVYGPAHYGGTENPHEVIKCLAAWGLEKDALAWNAAKYVGRAYAKGEPVENFKKAAWYALRRIAVLEGRDPHFYNALFKKFSATEAVRVKEWPCSFCKPHDHEADDECAGCEPHAHTGPAKDVYLQGRKVEIVSADKFRTEVVPFGAKVNIDLSAAPLEGLFVRKRKRGSNRAVELAARLGAPGKPGEALSASEFAEVRECLLGAYEREEPEEGQ